MKKIIIILFCVIGCFVSKAQFPFRQTVSNNSTLYYIRGGTGVDSTLVFAVAYSDTANANFGWIKNIPGAVIRTSNDKLWLRNNAATAWIEIGSGGGGGGAGTVTSVAQSFTGGLISVAGSPITTSGTLALTVAGTSGGIPYFNSGTSWTSSGVLAANALMIGGGAGAAPSTTTTGTGVLTALGINVGSAGAFVTFNGALGTPSSGTLTNATGLPPLTGIVGWPSNSSGVLTNDGSGNLSWGSGSIVADGFSVLGRKTSASGTAVSVTASQTENYLFLNGDTLQFTNPNLMKRQGNQIGTIFEKTTLADTVGLAVNLVSGGTATIVGDALLVNTADDGYGSVIYVDSFKTSLDVFQVEATIVPDSIFNAGNGITLFVGPPGTTSSPRWSVGFWFNLQSSNLGKMYITSGNSNTLIATTLATSSFNVPVSVGDSIALKLSVYESTVTAWARNVTQNTGWYSITYTYTDLETKMSIGNVGISVSPARFYLLNLKYSSQQVQGADVYLFGDSKFSKSTFQNHSYPALLKNNYGVIVGNSGYGDALSDMITNEWEIINHVRPVKILIENSNSIRYGVSAGTWQAQLDQLYTDFTAAGIDVYFTSFAENVSMGGTSQAAMDTYLQSTYPTKYVRSPYTTLAAGGDYWIDGVHLTNLGNQVAYEQTALDGKIAKATGSQVGIQFQDEGSNLGSAGTVDEIDFTGSGVSASRVGNKVTVDISGGGGGTPGGSNKQVQYNNSGAFGGYTGFEVGNTNNDVLITAGAATSVPLNVKGAGSQSANFLNVSSSSGTGDIAKINSSGQLIMGGVTAVAIQDIQPKYGIGMANITTDFYPIQLHLGTVLNNGTFYVQRGASGNLWNIGSYNSAFMSFSETAGNIQFNAGSFGRAAIRGSNGYMIVGKNDVNYATNVLSVITENTANNSVTYNFDIFERLSSGTHAAGIGVGMNYLVETAVFNAEIGAQTAAVATDVTSTSEDFDFVVKLMAGGSAAAEKFRVLSTGGAIASIINGSSSASGNLQLQSTTNGTKGKIDILDSVDFNNRTIENYSAKYNNQTGTSYTLVSADNGKVLTFDNASDITLTIPAGLPAGFTCTVVQLGGGEVIFTASSTTLHNSQSHTKTGGQYSVASLTMYTTDTFIFQGATQ